jgi:hypothetical protein
VRNAAVYSIVIVDSYFLVSPPPPGEGEPDGDEEGLGLVAEGVGHNGGGAGEKRQDDGDGLGEADLEGDDDVWSAIGAIWFEGNPSASNAPITAPNTMIEISNAPRAVHRDPSAIAAS